MPILPVPAGTLKTSSTSANSAAVVATKQTTKKPKKSRSAKLEAQNEHYALVHEAARTVSAIFEAHNMRCAVFGSLAAKLYGSPRCPKDVDILVCPEPSFNTDSDSSQSDSEPDYSAPSLKSLILLSNSRNFYLKLPRDPTATYRILWYRQSYLGPECKVDILTPGTMYLPHLMAKHILHIDGGIEKELAVLSPGIPVVPFSLLLLHKLQGWDDHRKAEESFKSKKQVQDAADIKKLMSLRQHVEKLKKEEPWNDEELFSLEFQRLSRERIQDYCKTFPDRAQDWKSLGFATQPIPDELIISMSSIIIAG
ncbi:hypothetical protein B0H34DRAFT_791941 [Crassisporium funariophilum]|nr:hypothetical protein B0H34DRAFT_791941 [Crassisporium funariophilum]